MQEFRGRVPVAYGDSADAQELSRRMFASGGSNWNEDSQAHDAVLALLGEHGDNGVAGALAYLDDSGEADVGAVIAWMVAGAYKGVFDDEGAFARDQFEDAVGNLFGGWDQAESIGFPVDLDMCEVMPWDEIGSHLGDGNEWEFIDAYVGGVHVFDMTIDLDDYRGAKAVFKIETVEAGPLGWCQWFAGCERAAVGVISHPVLGDVPACQPCTDLHASMG